MAATVKLTKHPTWTFGAVVELNGHDISNVTRGVTIYKDAGEPPRVNLDILATDGVDIAVDVEHVQLTVTAIPGYEVIEETEGSRRRFTVRRLPE